MQLFVAVMGAILTSCCHQIGRCSLIGSAFLGRTIATVGVSPPGTMRSQFSSLSFRTSALFSFLSAESFRFSDLQLCQKISDQSSPSSHVLRLSVTLSFRNADRRFHTYRGNRIIRKVTLILPPLSLYRAGSAKINSLNTYNRIEVVVFIKTVENLKNN